MEERISDNDLMKQFSDCSLEAYKTLFKSKKNVLFNYIIFYYRMKPDVAQDIVQNAMIKVYESKLVYNHKNKFNPWLMKMIKNLVLNEINQNASILEREFKSTIGMKDSYNIETNEETEYEQKVNLVNSEMSKLPDIHRQVIMLKYLYDLSLEEISQITKENINTIKSRLNRGLETLSNNLKSINIENL